MNDFIQGGALSELQRLPDNFVDCCVTSPPYFGLRDYNHPDQIGTEETPEQFVASLCKIFKEVHRVLKKEGTLWLNLGDSYNGSRKGIGDKTITKQATNVGSRNGERRATRCDYLKPKDLIGIPWMVAFALRSSGWYLRQDIIWSKPNPMPESITDRCTKSHEYIFLLSKSKKYYYDYESIKTKAAPATKARLSQNVDAQLGSDRVPGKSNGPMKAVGRKNLPEGQANLGAYRDEIRRSGNKKRVPSSERGCPPSNGKKQSASVPWEGYTANKRSVWTVTTKPFKEAHFATFPEELIIDCIKAGCPPDGIVLDPFSGAGTTALVARKLNRNFIAIELNPQYINIAKKRLHDQLGFFI